MTDEHATDEWFKLKFHSNIYHNSKQRFGVDYMIEEHATKE
jgi:hypothetical protein